MEQYVQRERLTKGISRRHVKLSCHTVYQGLARRFKAYNKEEVELMVSKQ